MTYIWVTKSACYTFPVMSFYEQKQLNTLLLIIKNVNGILLSNSVEERSDVYNIPLSYMKSAIRKTPCIGTLLRAVDFLLISIFSL